MVLRIVPSQVARLEAEIDAMNASLTSLTSFILPGGTPPAAALHLARAIARRAERAAVTAAAAMPINHHALAYLNRLSDWLFVASRAMNKAGAEDVQIGRAPRMERVCQYVLFSVVADTIKKKT